MFYAIYHTFIRPRSSSSAVASWGAALTCLLTLTLSTATATAQQTPVAVTEIPLATSEPGATTQKSASEQSKEIPASTETSATATTDEAGAAQGQSPQGSLPDAIVVPMSTQAFLASQCEEARKLSMSRHWLFPTIYSLGGVMTRDGLVMNLDEQSEAHFLPTLSFDIVGARVHVNF